MTSRPGPRWYHSAHHLDAELEPYRVDVLIRRADHLLERIHRRSGYQRSHVEVGQQLGRAGTGDDVEVDAGLGEARHQGAVDHRLRIAGHGPSGLR
jgi:hypothetical protein